MHKIRVEAGKKAAATRKAHSVVCKLIILYYNNYNCFHCLKYFQNSADESAGEEDEEEKSARLHKIRVEAGKKAAATRKAKEQVSS